MTTLYDYSIEFMPTESLAGGTLLYNNNKLSYTRPLYFQIVLLKRGFRVSQVIRND